MTSIVDEEDGLLERWSSPDDRDEYLASDAAGSGSGSGSEDPVWGVQDTSMIALALVVWGCLCASIPSEQVLSTIIGGFFTNRCLQVSHLWAMPLLGVCSATVGNAFPVAGGVVNMGRVRIRPMLRVILRVALDSRLR